MASRFMLASTAFLRELSCSLPGLGIYLFSSPRGLTTEAVDLAGKGAGVFQACVEEFTQLLWN